MNAFVWLVRRELWESRAVWMVPAVCAGVVLGSLLLLAMLAPHGAVSIDGAEAAKLSAKFTPQKLEAIAGLSHAAIAALFMMMVLVTQFFYSADALYGDRRDRSVLFWKSLPVGDVETVLSKLFVAAVVIPAAGAVATVVTQVCAIAIASAKLASVPLIAEHLWNATTLAGSFALVGYAMLTGVLWYLPLLGWLLLVSAWAPRTPLMWAFSPLALSLAEVVIFRSGHVWHMWWDRAWIFGLLGTAFDPMRGVRSDTPGMVIVDQNHFEVTTPPIDLIRPLHFLTSPSVWIGVAVGVVFVMGAIALRRYRDESTN
jgi:ABC-2 type transport system permease protein